MSAERGELFVAYKCHVCRHAHVGRHGRNSLQRRGTLQAYASIEAMELGHRAFAHLLGGDGDFLRQRFAAAKRKRRSA